MCPRSIRDEIRNAFFAKGTPGGRVLANLSRPLDHWEPSLLEQVRDIVLTRWNDFVGEPVPAQKNNPKNPTSYFLPVELRGRESNWFLSLDFEKRIKLNTKVPSVKNELGYNARHRKWPQTPVIATSKRFSGTVSSGNKNIGIEPGEILILPNREAARVAVLNAKKRIHLAGECWEQVFPVDSAGNRFAEIAVLENGRHVDCALRLRISPTQYGFGDSGHATARTFVGLAFLSDYLDEDGEELYGEPPVAKAVVRCYDRFMAHLGNLINRTKTTTPPPLRYTLDKLHTYLYVKNRMYELSPRQHAFIVTLIRLMVENGNSPVSARFVERAVDWNASQFFNISNKNNPIRFKEILNTEKPWRKIVAIIATSSGRKYRIVPRLMKPEPTSKPVDINP